MLADAGVIGLALLHFVGGAGAALAWRTAPPENEEIILSLLETGMVPLYLHYINDHRARLAALGRHDLTEAFGQWERRLLQ